MEEVLKGMYGMKIVCTKKVKNGMQLIGIHMKQFIRIGDKIKQMGKRKWHISQDSVLQM